MSWTSNKIDLKEKMRSIWLIQRLKKPYQSNGQGLEKLGFKDNPFAFGVGLLNGGISPEAMDLTREIWRYDYMGSAEFEWGDCADHFEIHCRAI